MLPLLAQVCCILLFGTPETPARAHAVICARTARGLWCLANSTVALLVLLLLLLLLP